MQELRARVTTKLQPTVLNKFSVVNLWADPVSRVSTLKIQMVESLRLGMVLGLIQYYLWVCIFLRKRVLRNVFVCRNRHIRNLELQRDLQNFNMQRLRDDLAVQETIANAKEFEKRQCMRDFIQLEAEFHMLKMMKGLPSTPAPSVSHAAHEPALIKLRPCSVV